MDQNSMESDDNSTDQMDDNLLEPLSEVSFNEREKSFHPTKNPPQQLQAQSAPSSNTTDKDPDSSLPDARAKVLHLQRVNQRGSSGSDTARSSSSKKRNSKSHSDDKDTEKDEHEQEQEKEREKEQETVSLSLDSLIRRGVMNEKLKAANFKSNFKFGKPDDDIALRVNPSANLFYEHSNEPYSDSESDSYESSGERDDPDEPKYGVTSNGSITNGNGLDDHAPVKMKRKRGRPPLTEEERNERIARKEAMRLQQHQSMMHSEGEVDDFSMAMGHSIFHVNSPKKRGRPPKNRYPQFLDSSGVQSEQETSRLNDSNASTTEFPMKKKRGRKPKSYYLEIAAAQTNESNADVDEDAQNGSAVGNASTVSNQSNSILNDSLPTGPKKRGRKPKFVENYFIKLEQQSVQQSQSVHQSTVQQNVHQMVPKILKKRGRKPKNYYLQQMSDQHNESAPAILQNTSLGSPNTEQLQQMQQSDDATAGTSTSFDFGAYANKRGRRPKAYYEHLATLVKQEGGGGSAAHSAIEQKYLASNSNILSDEPPLKKKRGRKPKSYYWNLQLQQEAENQSGSSNVRGDDMSSQGRLATDTNTLAEYDEQGHSASSNFLPTRPLSKPTVRTYIHRQYVRRIMPQQKVFRRPTVDVLVPGMPLKKKRGRKPKNYQPHLDDNVVGSSNIEPTESERRQQPNSYQALEERNRVLFELFEKRGDEIRILKQRMSNLINDKVEPSIDLDSMAWTNIELCKAYSLQRLNIPVFTYMRDKFSIPMPSTEDVRKFVRGIQLVRGLQTTMLRMLECDGQIYQEHEKLTILQVSYIKTDEKFEYDEDLDLIVGPHKYLTLIVARGLYRDWSQLVYFNFDTRVSKQNLNCVIEALHKIDFPVAALASNFEEGKTDIFVDLSINYGKGFFQHPITQEKIQCFYYLDDMLQATNAHFFGGHLTIDENQQSKQLINKQAVMQAIHKNYRRIPIPRELLAWTDNDMNNVDAIHTFFSQFTINLLRISLPDERTAKNVAEFISIIKSYAELMSRPQSIDSDIDTVNFDRYLEFQNKRLDKIHARLFKLDYSNPNDTTRKKFREAMMMSIVSLKMLRKSVMSKYKHCTFSTLAITNEIVRTKMNELISKHSFKRPMAPMQVFRNIKDIFLGEDCSVKIEPKAKFFFNGAVTAAEVNGRNESYYVAALVHWICEAQAKKHSNINDIKDLKRKLKKVEEAFCTTQNPNFRVCENAVNKITKDLTDSNAFEPTLNDIIREYIVQRHLLRIKYFNENQITRIAMPVQMTINLEE